MLRSASLVLSCFLCIETVQAQTCATVDSNCTTSATVTVAGIELESACIEVEQLEECFIANPRNDCAVLEAQIGLQPGNACVEVSSQCTLLHDGQCLETEYEISCLNGPVEVLRATLENRTFENLTETIVTDCGPQASDPTCQLQDTFEDVGASTRLINALSLSRVWWERTHRYHCSTGQSENTCADLETNPICRVTAEECRGNNADGSCARRNLTYRCESNAAIELACEPVNTCIGAECSGPEEPDTTPEFALATTWLNFLQQAGEQNNCDARDDASLPVNATDEGSVFSEVEDTGCALECLDYGEPDDFGGTECLEWATSSSEIEFHVFTGEANYCRYTGLWNCCTGKGYVFCKSHEHDLLDKVRAGSGHFILKNCGKRTWYGLCLHRRRHYCTYDTKFARVFQEQADVQTMAQFRYGEDPQCPGLTFEQMETLNVEVMDLTEVYDDMIDSADQPVEDLLIEQLQIQLNLVGGSVGQTLQ